MHLSKVIFHPERYPVDDCYPFNVELFRKVKAIEFFRPVTFFIGENGTGKSTLLKAICQKSGVFIWEDVPAGRYHYNRYEDDLYKYIEVQWTGKSVPGSFFSSQIFHDFARTLDERARATPQILDYFGGKSPITQSHGESFLCYFRSRYRIKGIYFMDEPETALSPASQLKLLEIIHDMGRSGHAQFIIASHSPILLACPDATLYSFDGVPLKQVNYEETEYYRIYRDFLNNRGSYLKGLED
jgi:predicted ATPase